MTIDGHKYVDELVYHEITSGYRNLSLSFKLKKGEPEPVLHSKYEEIEVNLDKQDVAQLLKVLFDLYRKAYVEFELPKDYEKNEVFAEEIRGVLEYRPEYDVIF